MKSIGVMIAIIIVAEAVSMICVGVIDVFAAEQPDHKTDIFVVKYDAKGAIHYITDMQYRVRSAAVLFLMIGFPIGIGLIALFRLLERKLLANADFEAPKGAQDFHEP